MKESPSAEMTQPSIFSRLRLSYGLGAKLICVELVIVLLLALELRSEEPLGEYSILEMSQLVILLAASIISFFAFAYGRFAVPIKRLFLVLALVLLVLMIRELSFGRVFYHDGLTPMSSEMKLFYKAKWPVQLLRWGTVFLLLIALGVLIREKLYLRLFLLLPKIKIYVLDWLIISVTVLGSYLSEKEWHMQNLEEFFEFLLYLALANLSLRYALNKNEDWGRSSSDRAVAGSLSS